MSARGACVVPPENDLGARLNVTSVVVCFNPDVKRVSDLCEALLAGGSNVVLVDNTEWSYLAGHVAKLGCELIELGDNTGIAHAQNVGIASAVASGADTIAFFDQDSKITEDFLPALIAPLRKGEPRVVSPVLLDDARGVELPATRLRRFGLPTDVYSMDRPERPAVDIVVASGSVATKEVFDLAGLMDEQLFIDHVDTEWCLRCRSKGIPIEVVPKAVMRHSIGSGAIELAAATVLLHEATRCYYQVRNTLLLFRMAHVPLLFALRETAAILWNRFFLLIHVEDRSSYLAALGAGVLDGVRGVGGKRPR